MKQALEEGQALKEEKQPAASRPLILVTNRGAAIAYLNIARRILGQRVPLMRIR